MALQKKTVIIALLVVAALLAAVKFFMQPLLGNKDTMMVDPAEDETAEEVILEPDAEEAVPASEPGAAMEAASAVAKAETAYTNPGGSDEVSFTLTVDQAGVITKAETGILAKNPTSKKRQESFAAALPGAIVGKKLSELSNIDRIGGSSLTTNAFNASLEKLKAQI